MWARLKRKSLTCVIFKRYHRQIRRHSLVFWYVIKCDEAICIKHFFPPVSSFFLVKPANFYSDDKALSRGFCVTSHTISCFMSFACIFLTFTTRTERKQSVTVWKKKTEIQAKKCKTVKTERDRAGKSEIEIENKRADTFLSNLKRTFWNCIFIFSAYLFRVIFYDCRFTDSWGFSCRYSTIIADTNHNTHNFTIIFYFIITFYYDSKNVYMFAFKR